MEKPYVPFYKPYGMTDEEYVYEVRIAEQKLAIWEAEYEAIQHPNYTKCLCDVCGSDDNIEASRMGKNCTQCHHL